MSSLQLEEGCPRDPLRHPTVQGQTLLGDKPKEVVASPNKETLPLTPTPPRPTRTGALPPYQRSMWLPKEPSAPGRRVTKMVGRTNRTGWKTPRLTPKVQAKKVKAKKWADKWM